MVVVICNVKCLLYVVVQLHWLYFVSMMGGGGYHYFYAAFACIHISVYLNIHVAAVSAYLILETSVALSNAISLLY